MRSLLTTDWIFCSLTKLSHFSTKTVIERHTEHKHIRFLESVYKDLTKV